MANAADLSSVSTGSAFRSSQTNSRSNGFLKFLAWPFSILFVMRPQREREAARIAEEFGCDRWCDALERRIGEHRGL
jgi:hypothetical protein